MSRSGYRQSTARNRSGRCVVTEPTSSPPLLPPRMASFSRDVYLLLINHSAGGNKVVKNILLFVQHAGVVPFLSEFSATAKVRHCVEAALLYPPSDERVKTGREADVKPAVAIQNRWNASVRLQPFAMNEEHRYRGPIFRLVP